MGKTRKSNLLLALAIALIAVFSCFFGVFTWKNDKKISASAETIEYQDLLGLEDRTSWGACNNGEVYFGGVTMEPFGYFNTADSVCGTWYVGNDAIIAANNGVDIMEYIYVNGVSARKWITDNANGDRVGNSCACWLSNPAACPVYVETTNGSGILVKLLKSAFGDTVTITFKAGFSLIRNDGETIYVSNDITYTYENGVLGGRTVAGGSGNEGVDSSEDVESSEEIESSENGGEIVDALDYDNYLGLEDRTSWASGGHADIVTLGIMDFSVTEGNQYFKSSVSDCWYQGNSSVIAANNGVDILQYVYLNGVSARDLLIQNQTEQKATANTGYWLSNPAAWPIAFETGTDCWIRIDKTKFGGNFTFTFKAGFSLIRNDGEVIYIANDIEYTYENGVLAKKPVEGGNEGGGESGGEEEITSYTLSFEGLTETKTVNAGEAIGELPEILPVEGKITLGWAIDGVVITADTVYNYGADKTATPVYAIEYDNLLGLEDRTSWGAHDGEYYFGGVTLEPFEYFNTADSVCGAWHTDNTAIIAANHGVDIMEYIYVNGVSARKWITDNVNGDRLSNTCDCWLSNPAACPVYVETTNGSGILVKLLKSVFGDTFTITFKAGFSLIRNDGETIYVPNDLEYTYVNGILGKQSCTLSFEGLTETKTVNIGEAIGELPEILPVEGKITLGWAIDGVLITADTVYNYGADKTAMPVYAIEYDNLLGLEDRTSWGAHDGEYYFGGVTLTPFGYFNTADVACGTWHTDNPIIITANNGVDIMEYIYVNGVSARKWITDNVNGDRLSNTCDCWLSNPVACPVYVETTNSSGILIKLLKSAFGDTVTITFKAGFSLIRNDEENIYLSSDVTYTYANGTLTGAPQYSVTFDGENEQIVRENKKATRPATEPTKAETEGFTYTFEGWYNGDVKWNFDDPVTENLALTAKFTETEKPKFTVTYNADNGTENVVVYVYTGAFVKTEQIPAEPEKSAEGATSYNFLYWSLDGENAYDFSTPITENITLTAVYTTKPLYTVTMGNNTVKVIEGGKITQPANPTKESTAEYDYTFEAWYNGDVKWDFEKDTVNSDLTLVAKYTETKRKYTVSFNVTGNDNVTFDSVEVEYGGTYDLTNLLDGIDVSDYTYTVTVEGEAVTSVNVVSNVTVDVAFMPRVFYTVMIDGVEQSVEHGEKAEKPATEPTKESTAEYDYTFDGWYNGETKWDFENDVVTSDLKLTAKYIETKRSYTVTFVVTGNDAITLAPVVVEYGTTYDLTNLLEGKDVSGYTYSITVGGVEKISFKVIGDTTVTVAFTKQTEQPKDSGSSGCKGSIGGAMGAMLAMAALGVVVAFKKKED